MHARRVAQVGGLLVGYLVTLSVASAAPSSQPQGTNRVDEVLVRHHWYPALEKLGRGAGNIAIGWAEIPATMHIRYSERDPVTTMFSGLAIGLVKGVIRTGVGVYETVTFFLPVPKDFAPILPPLRPSQIE